MSKHCPHVDVWKKHEVIYYTNTSIPLCSRTVEVKTGLITSSEVWVVSYEAVLSFVVVVNCLALRLISAISDLSKDLPVLTSKYRVFRAIFCTHMRRQSNFSFWILDVKVLANVVWSEASIPFRMAKANVRPPSPQKAIRHWVSVVDLQTCNSSNVESTPSAAFVTTPSAAFVTVELIVA